MFGWIRQWYNEYKFKRNLIPLTEVKGKCDTCGYYHIYFDWSKGINNMKKTPYCSLKHKTGIGCADRRPGIYTLKDLLEHDNKRTQIYQIRPIGFIPLNNVTNMCTDCVHYKKHLTHFTTIENHILTEETIPYCTRKHREGSHICNDYKKKM